MGVGVCGCVGVCECVWVCDCVRLHVCVGLGIHFPKKTAPVPIKEQVQITLSLRSNPILSKQTGKYILYPPRHYDSSSLVLSELKESHWSRKTCFLKFMICLF